jgi:hypothetical protein
MKKVKQIQIKAFELPDGDILVGCSFTRFFVKHVSEDEIDNGEMSVYTKNEMEEIYGIDPEKIEACFV